MKKGNKYFFKNKLRNHTKICKRCSIMYNTPYKFSKICDKCKIRHGKGIC